MYLSRKLCGIPIPRASDLIRNAKRRQNRIDFVRTSIYPMQRFRSPIRFSCLKGGKGARSLIYDFGPLISEKINGRKYATLTVKLLTYFLEIFLKMPRDTIISKPRREPRVFCMEKNKKHPKFENFAPTTTIECICSMQTECLC